MPTVYTMRWPKSLPARQTYEGIEVRRFVFRTPEGNPRRVAGAAATNPAILAGLVDALRRDRCQLIHIQCVSSAAWFAVQAARLLHLPLVATLQGELTMDADHIFERSPSARHALRRVLAQARAVTACSAATLAEAEAWYGHDLGRRARVIHNGVRVADFADVVPHHEDEPYVFALGRHVPQKGFDTLLEAMARLGAPGPEPAGPRPRRLLLAGDGPERPALEARARALGLADRVRFLGVTDRPTTAALFAGADLFVLPSRHEPFGIVSLEAMAAGTPVVATRVGGVAEIVADGTTGLLVAPEDPIALARAIERVGGDGALRHRLVAGGTSCAAEHDWSAIEARYGLVYDEVLDDGPAPTASTPSTPSTPSTATDGLRIAITSLYLPGSSKIGVGHQVHQFANVMQSRGHRVTVFSPDQPGPDAAYRHHHVDPGPSLRTFRFADRLRQQDWSGFDVLHAHGDDYLLHRPLVPGPGLPPHLRTMHGSCFAEALHIHGVQPRARMAVLGLTEVAASLSAEATVAVSANTCRWYPWIHRVIPCGVDLDRFHPGPPEARHERPTLLFVGTYEQRKRGRLLMEVFADQVRPALPDAQLWMVCSDAPGGPGVEVLGRLSDDELAERYRRAWVFCLPSTYEGFGVPYVEAMASGLPVVASPNPGAREVLDQGRLGVLADDHELGPRLIELLTSPPRRAELAERGLAAAGQYAWSSVAARYEALYAELLGRR